MAIEFGNLEGRLADAFVSNAGSGIGIRQPAAQISQLSGRADEPTVKPVFQKASEGLQNTLSIFYQATQPGLDENALKQQVGQAYNILVHPTKENIAMRMALSKLLQEFGAKLYETMPDGKKVPLAKDLQDMEFAGLYGAKLNDAWKDGTLIDKFNYATLDDTYKVAIFKAAKEGNGSSVIGMMQKLLNIAKAHEEEKNPEVKQNLEKVSETTSKELMGLVEAYITGVYGFSKEASQTVAMAILSDKTGGALQVFRPLFANAAKKAFQTMDAGEQKEATVYRGQQMITAMYGAPEVQERQAE